MKKTKVFFCMLMFLAALLATGRTNIVTTEASQTGSEAVVSINLSDSYNAGRDYVVTSYSSRGYNVGYISVDYDVKVGAEDIKVSCSSSDTKVVKIVGGLSNWVFTANRSYQGGTYIEFETCAVGAATITVQVGSVSETIDVMVLPPESVIKSLKQTGYNEINVQWDKMAGCSGYIIQRSASGKDKYSDIKKVAGSGKTSTTVKAEWNVKYDYRVLPYIQYHSRTVTVNDNPRNSYMYLKSLSIAAEKWGTQITSITKSGTNQLKVSWKKEADAVKYEIYRASSMEGTYKSVKVIKNPNTTSWKQKVTPGKQYYYYIVTFFPTEKSDPSDTVCGYLPKSGKKKEVSQNSGIKLNTYSQYGWNWASPDTVFYYQSGKKLYTAALALDGKKLNIYVTDPETLKLKKYKTIKLGKYDTWGGFYQGTDGKFYVALGYNNLKEKDSKTVIKVIQYSSKWKKGKVCSIKGNAVNAFKGIYQPFEAGNCRMAMQGNTLYVETCRTMYVHSDGLHHQSNIAFKIDTKTMKYSCATEVYSSHSFNQYVKFDNGNLYVVNHGDAYPRAVMLSIIQKYGTPDQNTIEKNVFPIKGRTGDNYTGLTVGGMETGIGNVLVAGTSVPQNKKVKGVSGDSSSLAKNVYLTVSDKETGKTTFRWLTDYNPKTSKVTVGELRMVKLSDQRFAILYSTTQGKSQKLNYVVVDNSGKKVYSKTYSNVVFQGSTQPILSDGSIIWTENYIDAKTYKDKVKTYRIPAVY